MRVGGEERMRGEEERNRAVGDSGGDSRRREEIGGEVRRVGGD